MKYYKKKVTTERRFWWSYLPEQEQALHAFLHRLKSGISKQKVLLKHSGGAKDVKEEIRTLKFAARAVKRQLTVEGDFKIKHRSRTTVIAWCCRHCQQAIPEDSKYCPYCGQRLVTEYKF